ncbi:MAG: DUF5666 domain-containing protein [Anaerolineae bacterium]
MYRRILALLGGLFVMALVAGTLAAASASASTLTTVSGKLNTVNLATRQMTVSTSTGTVTLKWNSTTHFVRNGVAASSKKLVLRDTVTAKYNSGTGMVTLLTATGPAVTVVSGAVTYAAKGTGVVTIGTTRVHTSANTKIARNGKVVALTSLTRKDVVVVHVAAGTNNALDMEDNGPEEGQVQGTITAISGNSVTITPTDGTAPVTVTADANTMIELDGQPAALTDLQLNMTAEAEYDPSTMLAYSIDAESEGEDLEVTGTVAAVDTTNNTITIAPSDGSPAVMLNVTASTEIQVNDASGTLADVQVGMPVQAEYDSVTMTANSIDAGTSADN